MTDYATGGVVRGPSDPGDDRIPAFLLSPGCAYLPGRTGDMVEVGGVDETCYCGGCIGMGPCDDGTECSYGCGGRATNPWGTCTPCEDEVQGRDGDDEEDW